MQDGPKLSVSRSGHPLLVQSVLALSILVMLGFRIRQTYATALVVCEQKSCLGAQLTRSQLHVLQHLGFPLGVYRLYAVAVIVLFVGIYSLVAAVIVWHRPSDHMAVTTGFMLVFFGGLTFDANSYLFFNGLPPWGQAAVELLAVGAGYLQFVFFLVFPNGRLVLRWPILLLLPLAIIQAQEVLSQSGPFPLGTVPLAMTGAFWVLGFAALIYVQVYRYRHVSNAVERQQTKWVVFGVALMMIGSLVTFGLYGLASTTGLTLLSLAAYPGTHLAGLILPFSIGVAVLRYRLWEVDALTNRTLVYGSLTLTLGALYLGAVIALQALFGAVTGQHSDLAIAIATLGVAALFNPWRHRLQFFIDRRFYRRKYDASRTLAGLSVRLRGDVELSQVTAHVSSAVQETMQPAHLSIWFRQG